MFQRDARCLGCRQLYFFGTRSNRACCVIVVIVVIVVIKHGNNFPGVCIQTHNRIVAFPVDFDLIERLAVSALQVHIVHFPFNRLQGCCFGLRCRQQRFRARLSRHLRSRLRRLLRGLSTDAAACRRYGRSAQQYCRRYRANPKFTFVHHHPLISSCHVLISSTNTA
ncbi:hypothetical protein D1872_271140 [compost metagenome]